MTLHPSVSWTLRSVALAPVALCIPAHAGIPADPPIEDQVMVRTAPGRTVDAVVASLLGAGLVDVQVMDVIPGHDTWLLHHQPQPGVTLAQLELMVQAPVTGGVAAWAEVNYASQTAEGKTDSLWVTGLSLPPWFPGQYSTTLLGVAAAHERSRGQGVVVAVVDGGADRDHPGVAGPEAVGSWNFLDGTPVVADVGNGLDDDGDGLVDEGVGHGTFVSSLIRLVAPEVLLMHLQVLDSEGRSDNFRVAKAIYHATDAGAQIINVSIGTTYRSASMEEACAAAVDAGTLVVGAMGNAGVEDPREYPACDGNAIGVAATGPTDLVGAFSNFGPRTDLCAPGVTLDGPSGADPAFAIVGAVPGGYATWQGTSLSAALVSGAAALVRAQHPEWPDAQVPVTEVPAAVVAALEDSAVPLDRSNPAYAGGLGAGRIDAAAAVLLGPPAPAWGDLDGDGDVDGADLGQLVSGWGPCEGCPADLNRDGEVSGPDLAILLARWSP